MHCLQEVLRQAGISPGDSASAETISRAIQNGCGGAKPELECCQHCQGNYLESVSPPACIKWCSRACVSWRASEQCCPREGKQHAQRLSQAASYEAVVGKAAELPFDKRKALPPAAGVHML